MVESNAIRELVGALSPGDERQKSDTYSAVVSHIDEEGTVWVILAGSDKETPTASTSTEVKRGDAVTVSWRDNKLYIGGNYSNPSAGVGTVMPSVDYVTELIDKDVTVNSINAATGYIGELTSDHITAGDISASSGYIKELKADDIEAEDIIADHATIDDLDVNYAKVNAANIDTASIRNAWIDKILVQTDLLAYSEQVYTLEAIQVDAANITAGTIDVERLIITVDGQKYLIHVNPSTGQPTYEKLDGNIVEPRTITADKIVAGSITTNEITANNLVGTSGWINLHEGKFFYGNGADFATATNAISWNGSKLQIKADEFLLSTGQTIQDSIESVENWFYSVPPTTSNPPASSWTTTNLKEQHLRDIYFDTTSGKSYRWAKEGSTYKWVEIEDVELAALAKDLHDNYPPRSEFTVAPNQIQSTVSAAQTAATNAANSATDTKLQSYYTKTQTDSAITQRAGEISLSVAQTEIGKIEVGGRNLLTKSTIETYTANGLTFTYDTSTGYFTVTGTNTKTDALWGTSILSRRYSTRDLYVQAGEEYQYTVYGNLPSTIYLQINGVNTAGNQYSLFRIRGNGSYQTITVTVPDNHDGTISLPAFFIGIYADAREINCAFRVKLEKGNKATDWTPAPEDVEAYTDDAVSTAKAEIKVTTDGISTEVSKKVGNSEVISKINQSPESITINANRVNIAGAAVFNNYSTTAQMNTAISNAVDDIEVGGRNIIKSTTVVTKTSGTTVSSYDKTYNGFTVTTTGSNATARLNNVIDEANTPYTISFTCTASVATTVTIDVLDQDAHVLSIASGTSKVVCTMTPTRAVDSTYHFVDLLFAAAGTFKLANIKLEKGNKATDWTPAPEDVQAEIDAVDSKADGANSQEQRIYYRSNSTTAPTAPSTWVTSTSTANATWSTKRMQYDSTYKYLYTCIQRKTVGGTISNSTVLLDDTTTVIDGGNIITGTVTANQIAANAVTADKIHTNAVTAAKLDATTINASNKLTVGAMTTAEQEKILNSNVQVGGRNLWAYGTDMQSGLDGFNNYGNGFNIVTEEGYKCAHADGALTTTKYLQSKLGYIPKPNEIFTYSCYVKIKNIVRGTTNPMCELYFGGQSIDGSWKGAPSQALYVDGVSVATNGSISFDKHISDQKWHHFAVVAKYSDANYTALVYPNVYLRDCTGHLYVRNLKAERGNKATDWTPAPEEEVGTNLLSYPYLRDAMSGSPFTTAGITFTLNKDGSVTAKGTATANAWYQFTSSGVYPNNPNGSFCLPAGTYAISGCPSGGASGTYRLQISAYELDGSTSFASAVDYGDGAIINLTKAGLIRFECGIINGHACPSAGYTFKPMLEAGRTIHSFVSPTATEAASQSATKYITRIDDGGIFISPGNQSPTTSASGNSVKINASGMEVYKGGTSVAAYGDTARIGVSSKQRVEVASSAVDIYSPDNAKRLAITSSTGVVSGLASKGHTVVNDSGLTVYDTNNKLRTSINASGLNVNDTDGSTSVASFGSTARIGKQAGNHVDITSTAISMAEGSKTLYEVVNAASGIVKVTQVYNVTVTPNTPDFTDTIELGRTVGSWVSQGIILNYKLNGTAQTAVKWNTLPINVTSGNYVFKASLSGTTISITWSCTIPTTVEKLTLTSIEFNFNTSQQVAESTLGAYADKTQSGAFRVGKGTSTSAKANAMLLDWGGTARLSGDVVVNCDANSSGGLSLSRPTYAGGLWYEDSHGVVSIDAYRVGKVVMMYIYCDKDNSTSAGGTVYGVSLAGTGIPVPFRSGNGMSITGATYYSKSVIVCSLERDTESGSASDPISQCKLYIKNASTSAVTLTGAINCSLTYICE